MLISCDDAADFSNALLMLSMSFWLHTKDPKQEAKARKRLYGLTG
jgi:hypothetical protein